MVSTAAMDTEPTALDERVEYWKARADSRQAALVAAQDALNELEEMSRGLEAELESELAAAQRARDSATRSSEVARAEAASWKTRYKTAMTEHEAELAAVRKELARTTHAFAVHRDKLRDMEVSNDELEAAERAVTASLADMEVQYNRALEQTALLQEEIAAKEALSEENQRLKDQVSELTEELAVRKERNDSLYDPTPAETAIATSPSTERPSSTENQLPFAEPQAEEPYSPSLSFSGNQPAPDPPFYTSSRRPVESSAPPASSVLHAAYTSSSTRFAVRSAIPRPSVGRSIEPVRTSTRSAATLQVRLRELRERIECAQHPLNREPNARTGIPRPSPHRPSPVGTPPLMASSLNTPSRLVRPRASGERITGPLAAARHLALHKVEQRRSSATTGSMSPDLNIQDVRSASRSSYVSVGETPPPPAPPTLVPTCMNQPLDRPLDSSANQQTTGIPLPSGSIQPRQRPTLTSPRAVSSVSSSSSSSSPRSNQALSPTFPSNASFLTSPSTAASTSTTYTNTPATPQSGIPRRVPARTHNIS